ncbi:hypothetical protein KM043_016146 [Ampulex compressa]|nr:hypothetical protein KM043_016146 [Ampulex compressa]
MDGTKFDSSKDRNAPFTFTLGYGHVLKAWDIGIATMKRKEVAILYCTPKYMYGRFGSTHKIPHNTLFKFEIEIIDWKEEDISQEKDGSIRRCRITNGKGKVTPKDGSLVNIHLVGQYNGNVFEDRDVQFTIGEGAEIGIVSGVEIALTYFKSGEKSRLKIKSKHAFKEEGKKEFNIPPGADVEYIVELKSFEKFVRTWKLDHPEQIEQATLYKQKDDSAEERKNLLLSAYLNLAICYLKTNQDSEAKNACNKALELSPGNEKALFRRGQAYLALASPEIAINDFHEVLKIEPKNTAAMERIRLCNSLIKKQLAKEKNLYANMFEKFAQKDRQKEEEELRQQPDVMHGAFGEWSQDERPGGRDATAFEKENPNILMLNANGTGEFQNM